ncbi:uncharacterized protein CcaverHIS019_0704090 [Cutaneotrichosporon cavernicola]|uniref:Sld7 C-terminal domain-containing protein n=1 Tax=Cutaneotrichosporon cavernicola TaxID=279322 RepID=A0AA48LAF7_9TREE|nr:uncharacterized protein CcaverHIS019_0704090 [Cutaneotrichosporon cavernicola]BEI94828.1 hypothetical protein CcaverHIS019_0704090 [Cutaneotrichosporon cavernicola]
MLALGPTRSCNPPSFTSMSGNPFARPKPSPSKGNPFARVTESTSFTRKALLPATASPKKTPTKSQWRMLWRGGFEIGSDGWRLDGVVFFALLTFPSTPTPSMNPFAPPTPGPSDPALPTDADLCLSLESLRGRKYLAVRGTTELADDDVLDGEEAAVQMSTASPVLAAYLTGMLCRETNLAPSGRTRSAMIVGLGDGEDANVLIYGQRVGETEALKLCVGRRKPPPPPEKIRPGEPLPRAPPEIEAPRRGFQLPKRAISRANSMQAYAAPPVLRAPGLPISGRLGEKRSRMDDHARAGLIIPEREEDVFGGITRPPSVRQREVVDNKGCIRKITMNVLEERGFPREGEVHKERRKLEGASLDKAEVRDIVGRHLNMYLPAAEPKTSCSWSDSTATDIREGGNTSLPQALLRTPTRQVL